MPALPRAPFVGVVCTFTLEAEVTLSGGNTLRGESLRVTTHDVRDGESTVVERRSFVALTDGILARSSEGGQGVGYPSLPSAVRDAEYVSDRLMERLTADALVADQVVMFSIGSEAGVATVRAAAVVAVQVRVWENHPNGARQTWGTF